LQLGQAALAGSLFGHHSAREATEKNELRELESEIEASEKDKQAIKREMAELVEQQKLLNSSLAQKVEEIRVNETNNLITVVIKLFFKYLKLFVERRKSAETLKLQELLLLFPQEML